MSAAHVMLAARDASWTAMGSVDLHNGRVYSSPIGEVAVLRSHDVAFFQSSVPVGRTLPWLDADLPMGTLVHSVGYPYALDQEHAVVIVRMFAGHIVSLRTLFDFT